GWGHPEHPGRLRAVARALAEAQDLAPVVDLVEGRKATADDVASVHDSRYVEKVQELARRGGGWLDADTVVSEGSWDAALAAVGSVLTAVDMAFSQQGPPRSFCAVRPPGHHALRDRGMGFCLFGNVALGAHYARKRYGVERVLIVDFDVHHGNGTQALVETTPGIHFVSMHQWPWYPGTGAADDRGPLRTVWNLPMPPGLSPREYVETLVRGVDDATRGFVPELLLVSAGFDCLRGDPLGGFTLEPQDLGRITRLLVERARVWCSGRVVAVLEGGYRPERLAAGVVEVMRALAGAAASGGWAATG
ncbi:MAG TPA: histone deacetylase, partial [Gemmatimonadaceae bacterium]|nr:histone deacetylase [Gemmatimonadaceae bacterium]